MGKNFESGLVAGVTAAVIWTSICLWVGWTNTQMVGLWALIFLVVGTIGTAAIANVISSRKAGTANERT